MDDLSDYERLRLENIRRNEAFLASLGLDSIRVPKAANTEKDKGIARRKAEARLERKQSRVAAEPVRRSSRIAGVKTVVESESEDDGEEQGEDENEGGVNYAEMPSEPNELDDHEFQALVLLRKWRLTRCRELQTEAYKIFQTRTLCEAIRRRRNSPSFGAQDIVSWTEIWGIGPGKIREQPEKGWAWELRDQLDSIEAVRMLQSSRDAAPVPDEGGGKEDEGE